MTGYTLLSLGIGSVATMLTAGFAIHDLTKLPVAPATVLGEGFEARTEPARAIMMCSGCVGAPIVDIRIGRQDDGTEARFRAGTTTVASLEGLCRQRDPACRIEGLQVAPAIGWMSSYKIGAQSAHTIIVLRDGDLLTMRVLSTDASVARKDADLLVAKLVPVIVGE